MASYVDSFLPEDYLQKRIERRTNIICLGLFVVVMGGVVGGFIVTIRQRAEVMNLRKQVDAQFVDAARRIEQLDELQRRKQQMIRKAKTTALLLERVPRSILLAELINNMPETLSLLEFELESKVVTPRPAANRTSLDQAKASARKKAEDEALEQPEVPETEVAIRMVGVAPTDVQVAQFMTALGRSDLFTDVNLAFSEEMTIDKEPMRKFRIEMRLNQNVDTRKYEPKMVRRELKQNPMDEQVRIAPLVTPGGGPKAAPVKD